MTRFWILAGLGLIISLGGSMADSPGEIGSIGAKISSKVGPDGKTEIQLDLPEALHLKNVGGSDGAGLCVFTSITHAARWQHVPSLEDFQQWMRRYPGGGWPQKVTQKIKEICASQQTAEPRYLQVEGRDLDLIKLACRTGRMPGVTYSYSPTGRYAGQKIAHMVNLVAAGVGADERAGPDGRGWWVVLDNNFPGERNYEWLSEAEFIHTHQAGGSGWTIILLEPGPPPVPRN